MLKAEGSVMLKLGKGNKSRTKVKRNRNGVSETYFPRADELSSPESRCIASVMSSC